MSEGEKVTVREVIDEEWIQGTASAQHENVLRALIAKFAEQRTEWRTQYSLWLGWGPFMLLDGDGGYVIHIPDYTTDPRQRLNDDLTSALDVLVGQTLVHRETQVEPLDALYNHELIAVRGWQESEAILLTRIDTDPEGRDSGWFIEPFPPRAEGPYESHEMVRDFVWGAVKKRTAVGRVVALPPGLNIVINGDSITTISDGDTNDVIAQDV